MSQIFLTGKNLLLIVDGVAKVMAENNVKAFEVSHKIVGGKEADVVSTSKKPGGLSNALMTPMESVSAAKKAEWLKVLMG